ncbi:unnamed protein product [Microthlaspi erraticum]|uniref:F-box domain-containing protein n=1 Tax=Microthlaspi erraticum TaxID=1685480 RepID=A0A6D2KCY0_9BRAS|nr:unnamed protein product [Microthlaspi erraticum]
MGLSLKSKRLRQAQPEIQIPMELVTEILTSLPTKSLMRFNCVSKLLSSLIRSQYFTNRIHKFPSQRLYMCLSVRNDNRKTVILSSAPDATTTTTTPSTSFVVNHELTIPYMNLRNMQSLCGFMCEGNSYFRMPRIYNPATRQLVNLPTRYSDSRQKSRAFYYFGHDPVNNQYKVCSIEVQNPEHWVLVLKPGASWKKAAPTSFDFCPYPQPGISINGVIYYMAFADKYKYNYIVMLVSFDIGSEEFETIQMPPIEVTSDKVRLIEYDGKLTVFEHTHLMEKGKVHLWVLKDVGNKEWSRKTLVLKHSQFHLVDFDRGIGFDVKGTSQSGKVLLIPKYFCSPLHILCYDLQSNDMRKIDIKGIPEHCFSNGRYEFVDLMFMDQSESILYLET